MASAKSDLTGFAKSLVDVEQVGRLKLPNVWALFSNTPYCTTSIANH